MKKLMFIALMPVLMILTLAPTHAKADIGPHPILVNCPNQLIYCYNVDGSCGKYTNNPNYELASPGASYSGYCPESAVSASISANYLGGFFTAKGLSVYIINATLECLVALLYIMRYRKSRKIVLAVLIVNLISWPIFYAVSTNIPTVAVNVMGEIAVWLGEALGIYLICKRLITMKQALLLSLVTNTTTVIAGVVLYLFLVPR